MAKKTRVPLPQALIDNPTVEKLAAITLTATFRMAEAHGLCPLCVMDCAIEMMDEAEKAGAIRHIGDDDDFPTVAGVH